MQCLFLKGETVRYCEISPFRKMISKGAAVSGGEICSSPDYVDCPLVKTRREAPAGRLKCPFLRTALVQYCSATPAACLIPYSDALVSRCTREGHRYCDLFLSRMNPAATLLTTCTDQSGLIGLIRHLHGHGFVLQSVTREG